MKKEITIIQINDSHAYFELHNEIFREGGEEVCRHAGGYARVYTLLEKIRKETSGNVLFLDCGDTFHGTYPAIATQGEVMIPVMNRLGCDAMTAHWEYAYGPERFNEIARKLNYPVIAANIYDQKTNRLVFEPYIVKNVNGIRVGIVGLACNITDKTMPPHFSEGIYFTLGRDELSRYVEKLRQEEKVDFVVLLSHLGFPQEMKLLGEVKGVDVCLSGHTHHRLEKAVRCGAALVMQSGCHGSFLGKLSLTFDNGNLISYKHELLEVEGKILPDSEMEKIINSALEPFREKLRQELGKTEVILSRNSMLETTADNFLLSAVIESSGAEMAFSNGWRYGAPVPPGPVTENDLYNFVPMDPPIVLVDLTGAEIKKMLEENLERTFSSDPYEQMGGYVKRVLGLKIYFKIENPKGHRLQKVFVGNKLLDEDKVYTAAAVTEQGIPKKFGNNRRKLSIHVIDAMKEYLKTHSPLKLYIAGTYTPV